MSKRKALADDGVPVCPYCGSTRHDSERLRAGNVMSPADLIDAMLTLFLRDPDEPLPAGIRPDPFPEAYPQASVTRLRAKMEAALGTAIRNMPYLADDSLNGFRVVSPGHVLIPRTAEEAKAMWLTGERWVRDHAPELLRPDTDPSLERVEAMRERCAAVCQRMIAVYTAGCDGPSSDDAWAANALESARSQIRALPLATEEPTR